jgi:hypothetical protein
MHVAATIIGPLAIISLSTAAYAAPLPRPRPPEAPAVQEHLSSFGDRDPTCTYWSDFCRNCMRAFDGSPSCNSIDSSSTEASCVPREVRCMRWQVPLPVPEGEAR